MTSPEVQGRRLFPEGFEVPRLRLRDGLREVKAFRSGIAYPGYAPA